MFCKFKFCIEHAHARKHGCDEAIAKAGREKYGSGGGGTFGGGRPTRTGDELQRSLAARLDASEQGRKKKATGKTKKKKKSWCWPCYSDLGYSYLPEARAAAVWVRCAACCQ